VDHERECSSACLLIIITLVRFEFDLRACNAHCTVMSVVFVCLPASISPKLHVMAAARFFCGGVAICYVLPVPWMTSYLLIVGHREACWYRCIEWRHCVVVRMLTPLLHRIGCVVSWTVAWWAVRRYEHSYRAASVTKKLKIELKDNAKIFFKWIKIFRIIRTIIRRYSAASPELTKVLFPV